MSRQNTNGHVFDYHGNFIPQIANQAFLRYTKENDIIMDWFLGSGTSAIEAVNLSRRLIGVELKQRIGRLREMESFRGCRRWQYSSDTG